MLNILNINPVCDKQTYINNIIKLTPSNEKVLILVPEQFAFLKEKEMHEQLKNNVTATSFSRIAYKIFKKYGGIEENFADQTVKLTLMKKACNQVFSDLNIFKSISDKMYFITSMLEAVNDFKNCGITYNELNEASFKLQDELLIDKTKEITLIYGVYDALLHSRYIDPLDNISRAVKKCENTDYFANTTIVLDEFNSFTYPEYKMIEQMLKCNCSINVLLTKGHKIDGRKNLFETVIKTQNRLLSLAHKFNNSVKNIDYSDDNIGKTNQSLVHLEKSIFSSSIKPIKLLNNDINLSISKNEYAECEYICAVIFNLIKEDKYRYNDILITSNDLLTYRKPLEEALKKYNHPYSINENASIQSQSLIKLLSNVFLAIKENYKTDYILSILKSNLLAIDKDIVNQIENYCFIWDIKGKQWTNDFTFNPSGLREFKESDISALEKINGVRQKIMDTLITLKTETTNATGKNISLSIFTLLKNLNVFEKVQEINKQLLETDIILANREVSIWNIVMDILDKMAQALGDEVTLFSDYVQMFFIVINEYEMGMIEETLDCLKIGEPTRISAIKPKVLFILGCNDSVFPKTTENMSLFTDREKEQLIECDLNMSATFEEYLINERFIVYSLLTTPTRKLYLSARKLDLKSSQKRVSMLYNQFEKMFSDLEIVDTDELDISFYFLTKQAAFNKLTQNYSSKDTNILSVKKALIEDSEYKGILDRIDNSLLINDKIMNKKEIRELYSDALSLSPTSIETYFKCPYMFFCKYGLNLKSLIKAEYNPIARGNLVHDLVNSVFMEISNLSEFETLKVNRIIDGKINDYTQKLFSNGEEKKRVVFLLNKFKKTIFNICNTIFEEQRQSDFKICDTEYEISYKSEVKPLTFHLKDNANISIHGRVDRIDMYVNESLEKYIRVIDYKTGVKKFSLEDIINGINIQMLLYLFNITKNGRDKYSNTLPAGVLYFPALNIKNNEQYVDDFHINKIRKETHEMNGLILGDNDGENIDLSIILAMEKEVLNEFIPVKLKKDATIARQIDVKNVYKDSFGNILTKKQFENIYDYLKEKIINMGNDIYDGNICKSKIDDVCKYCDYKNVCDVDSRQELNSFIKYEKEEISQILFSDSLDNED